MKKITVLALIFFMFFSFKISLAREEFIVTNTNSSGEGSFLYAVKEAVNVGGVVKFNIPESDKNFNGNYWFIKLKSPLPKFDKPVIIDGLSQTKIYGDENPDGPEIVIDASMVIGTETLFYFRRDGFEISGIEIINFDGKNVIETKGAKGKIYDITIKNGNIGIHLYKASNVSMESINLSNLKYGLYLYYSNYNVINDVYAKECDYGIRFYYSMANEIKDSIIEKCDLGIRVFYNSINNRIHDSKLFENNDGIWIRDSHNMKNKIYNNEFEKNENGVHLLYATKVNVYSNKFSKNSKGIFIESFSENNEISDNSFVNNDYGVFISNYSKNNLLKKNSFDLNRKPIVIEEDTCIPNTLSENIITNNSYRGIIINSDKKTPAPDILKVGLMGKSIALEVESANSGTVEVFLSNYEGSSSPHPLDSDAPPYRGDSKKFLGKSEVNSGRSSFLIPTNLTGNNHYITSTLTDTITGTSEFSLNKKMTVLPFIDATLLVSSSTERGERVKFNAKIRNKGKGRAEDVSFQCFIPDILKDVTIDSVPDGAKKSIEGSSIFVNNIDIKANSFVSISFSAILADYVDVGTKISLQGEVKYSPLNNLLITEKTDKDEFDDEIPDSDVGDEKTEFVVEGKPELKIYVNHPQEVTSNSVFNINVSIKNTGSDTARDVALLFNISEDFDFISASMGKYLSRERSFALQDIDLKPEEEINLSITLKSKSTIEDKTVSLNFELKGKENILVRSSSSITIRGEGRENVVLNISVPQTVNLLEEFEVRIDFKNSGERESEEKILELMFDENVKFLFSTPQVDLRKDKITYRLKPLSSGETKTIILRFKVISGCKNYREFYIDFNNERRSFKVFVDCLRVYHHAIVSGFPEGTFKPGMPVRRVDASVVLTNALLLKPSLLSLPEDVPVNYWGSKFISSVIGVGIMKGYPDGTFKPEKYLTRIEASAIVFKILSLKEDYSVQFKDMEKDYWGRGIIGAVVKNGIMKGYPDGTFKPDRYITRSEFLVIFLKAIGRGKASFTVPHLFSDVNENFWAYPFIVEATVPHVVINPVKVGEIKLGDKNLPVFGERFNSIVEVVKIGDRLKVSIPFLFPDMREIEITVSKVGIKP